MSEPEIITILNDAVHNALLNRQHELREDELRSQANALLATMPSLGNNTSASVDQLLHRYHGTLHKELCNGLEPVAQPEVIEDELRMITRAVVVAIETQEGISMESAVLLALIIRAHGLDKLCALPATPQH